jgi:hypothetical protein
MKVSRRNLLRGAGGIAVGLPWLESRAQNAAPIKRFVGVYHPNGVFTPQWFPTGSETNMLLGPIHTSLERFKSQLMFTSGLDMSVAISGAGEQHQRGVGAFLTGAKLLNGNFVGNDGSRAGFADGASVDQLLLPLISAGATPISSLQLGVHTLLSNVAGVVSYSGSNQPLLPENDPRLTFKKLFTGSGSPPNEMDKIRLRRKSVLDAVRDQLSHAKKTVSASDKTRLDRHLTLIRELEMRVTAIPTGTCGAPADPGVTNFERELEMPNVSRLQIELMLLAFRCDLTRVATIMYSDAMNHLAMPFICDTANPNVCVTQDVHNLTHASDGDAIRIQVAWRDRWVADQVAKVLGGLDDLMENGVSALSRSLLLWGSDVSRGNVHAHDDMPFLLAGDGAGFRMGRSVRWTGGQYHNDLLTAILRGFGGTQNTIGDPAYNRGALSSLT